MKRSHESWVAACGCGGGGEEQNFRQRSNSPGRRSVEPASPSSSNASARKKMVCDSAQLFPFSFFNMFGFSDKET